MTEKQESTKKDDYVFVGKKSTMSYVFAVATQAQNQKTIRIRARGTLIGKAVDVSQIALHRFLKGWNESPKEVIIGTQEKVPINSEKETDKLDRVSFIEIVLTKKSNNKK